MTAHPLEGAGVPFLQSALLAEAGFVHGFSLRPAAAAGSGEGALGSGQELASGGQGGALVASERVDQALAAVPAFQAKQVHGRQIVRVRPGMTVPAVAETEADALISQDAGLGVAVRTADCLPLLLADRKSGTVAAVHCGWRGVAAGIVAEVLSALPAGGDWLAAIGPHIRLTEFEVGEEVVAELQARAGDATFVSRDHGPKPHVDLAALVRAQLASFDVQRVDDVGGSTMAEPGRCYSYRRNGRAAGRHHAFVVARSMC